MPIPFAFPNWTSSIVTQQLHTVNKNKKNIDYLLTKIHNLAIFYNIYYYSNMSIQKERYNMINTVIIDAQKKDREKVTSVLSTQGDIKVLAQGKDGYDALKLTGSLKPDIAILDNHLDFIGGEEIPPLLRARSPSTAVVILTAMISDYQLYRAVSNAVSGFVFKKTDMDVLPGILKGISGGGCFISPSLAARVLHLLAVSNPSVKIPARHKNAIPAVGSGEDPTGYLSKTELLILTRIGEGHTSDEIAKDLNLTVGTVRNYISSVMHKTGLQNRSQMVRYAFCYGLVPLSYPAEKPTMRR